MPKFNYNAINKQGRPSKGIIEASSPALATQTLDKQGFHGISVKEIRKKSPLNFDLHFGSGVKQKEMAVFTRQLSTMISAGVPLVRSLATLREQTGSKKLKAELETVTKDVESGISLADALEKHPAIFSPIYVNMVRAGEAGGILDEILKKLALQQEKDASIRTKVKSAATYPVILLTITFGAFFGLMILVVPRLGALIQEIGGPDATLPLITRIMLGISDFLRSNTILIIIALIVAIFLFRRWHRTTKGKKAVDSLLMKTPIIKGIIVKVTVARFSRIFSSLMGAGVSVLEALDVTGKALGNSLYVEALEKAADEVQRGKQLSEPIAANPHLFPPIVAQMLAIGEETGQSETILIKVADFYEEEVDAVISGLSSIIEPIMIALLGAMVGLIAISVLGPITSLSQNL